ncbi:MAG: hypothetical protein LKJ28_03930 [Bifidobacteriaceae bacterium]|nr:hypothetical protein [Bifidobacteriaceae bacterium]
MHNSKDSEKSAYIITNSSSGGTDSEATAAQQSPFYGRPEQQTQRYSQNNAAQSGTQGGTQSGAQGGAQTSTAQQGQTSTTSNGYAAEYAANGYQQTTYPRNAYQQGNYQQGGQIPVSALPKQKGKSDSKTPWIARLHTGPFIALVAGISLLFGLIGGFGGSAIAFMNSRPSSTQMQMGGPGMMGQSGSGQSGSGSGQAGSGQSGQSGSGSGSTGSDSGSSSDSEQSDMGSLSGSTGITYLQIQS